MKLLKVSKLMNKHQRHQQKQQSLQDGFVLKKNKEMLDTCGVSFRIRGDGSDVSDIIPEFDDEGI